MVPPWSHGVWRQGPVCGRFAGKISHRRGARPWLIIINFWDYSNTDGSLCQLGAPCDPFQHILPALFLFAASAALADSRVFIIANQADGYGVDQCLARGDKCGAHAARSYCQSRDFAQAAAYRRVDPDEMTGAVPQAPTGKCAGGTCGEYVAIICQR